MSRDVHTAGAFAAMRAAVRDTRADRPVTALAAGPVPKVVLSYGLGVDSTAILVRWLTDPASRDFDLSELVVITAMTGDEWPATGAAVTEHVLPLLRSRGVRYVQVARSGRYTTTAGDGVTVLDDSTHPTVVHLSGAYRLSDELLEVGTVPQASGARLCSVHSKGDALDPAIAALTRGRPYRHVIGFESAEPRRAAKDTLHNTDVRTGEYPLIEWGWDRARCVSFLQEAFGVTWEKSACVMCPFALATSSGRTATFARFRQDPTAGAFALMLEHTAVALNPTQGLIAGDRLYDAMAADRAMDEILSLFHAELDATTHALYDVRRILRPRKDDPTKLANAARAVTTIATGARHAMVELLTSAAGTDVVSHADRVVRRHIRHRTAELPSVEHFHVVAPAGVLDKQQQKFSTWWTNLTGETMGAADQAALF